MYYYVYSLEVGKVFPTKTQNSEDEKDKQLINSIPQIVFIFIFYFIFNFSFLGRAAQCAGSYFPDQGSNPCSLQWKCGVLTTGLPGKSPQNFKLKTL